MIASRRCLLAGLTTAAVSITMDRLTAAPRRAPATAIRSTLPAPDTRALQAEIDAAAQSGRPVVLPAGTTRIGALTLRPGTNLRGAGPTTRLIFTGGPSAAITARNAASIRLENFTIDGDWRIPEGESRTLLSFSDCENLAIDTIRVTRAAGHGLALARCTGRIERCDVSDIMDAGIFALDSRLAITGNAIEGCGNNGILVWRSTVGEDGSEISRNRISRIRTDLGGSGQYGNGINVFRAGGVRVQNNTITDCAYTAVRGNAASNLVITGNTCLRLGEVALYAEFGFEGAIIASNIIDRAATGISVTNFNEGGRLAVVQGNLIRNLFRRETEPVDKRGHGIAIEADTNVSGNTIEAAPTAGILIGWGPHMRDVAVTGNVIRASRSGVLISSDVTANGRVLVSSNLITGATDGAIRGHQRGRVSGPDLAELPDARGRISIVANSMEATK